MVKKKLCKIGMLEKNKCRIILINIGFTNHISMVEWYIRFGKVLCTPSFETYTHHEISLLALGPPDIHGYLGYQNKNWLHKYIFINLVKADELIKLKKCFIGKRLEKVYHYRNY